MGLCTTPIDDTRAAGLTVPCGGAPKMCAADCFYGIVLLEYEKNMRV